MTTLAPLPVQSFRDSNGNPLAGGLLYTYAAGTSTPLATSTDSTGGTPNANPVVLNSRGEANVWLVTGSSYKFALYDASAVLIWTVDNISNSAAGSTPVSLASAATTDIGGQTSQSVEISGTTAIASFGTTYNGPRFLRFTGALVLTQSASLNLPTAANITTAAGDTAIAYPNLAANGWNIVQYQRADGTAIFGSSSGAVAVRQTVLSGPVDANGFAAFVGATGTTTVTATATLKATAAAGGDANYTGSITNPSWTGLSTNGTMYLYLDVSSAGVVTAGSTTIGPAYQWGGTYSITNLQNTFNIQEMTMKMGNGTTAAQVYRVFVGEVTVAAAVVSAITWYALMGRYRSADVACGAAATAASFSHNIGVQRCKLQHFLVCFSATGGWAVGDTITNVSSIGGTNYLTLEPRQSNRNTATVTTAGTTAYAALDPSTGSIAVIGNVNFNQFMVVDRGW